MSEQPAIERVKWFTLARKFPQLIGRTPDGARIPGGPYTITQALGGLVVLVVGYYSMGLWAAFGVLGNYVVLLAVTGVVVFGLGRIPLGSRNPAAIGMGALRALSAPQHGRLRGRSVRIRRPRPLRQRVVICTPIQPSPAATKPTPDREQESDPAEDLRAGDPIPAAHASTAPAPAPAPAAQPVPAYPVSAPAAAVHRPRLPRVTDRGASSPQLTGVQALLASAGAAPSKEN